MIRSTTPKQRFFFDENPDTSFDEILITYWQGGKIVLEKTKDDLTFAETVSADGIELHEGWFRMTQEETKMFNASVGTPMNKVSNPVKVQVKVLTKDGIVLANEIKTIAVKDVLNDCLMGDEAEEEVTP